MDTSGEHIVLLIAAEDDKGGQDREYPVTPDFEQFLLGVPEAERIGHVFNVVLHRGVCRRIDTVSKKVSALGEAAGVKVDVTSKPSSKGRVRKTVYASAHDFRRAFGTRRAPKVKPVVLRDLMRHESVTTTEKYYVGLDAQDTARLLASVWEGEQAGERAGVADEEHTRHQKKD